MSPATSVPHVLPTPCQVTTMEDAGFADSAIMDMTTPSVSPRYKPQLESGQFEPEAAVTPFDQTCDGISERLGHLGGSAVPSDDNIPPGGAFEGADDYPYVVEPPLDLFSRYKSQEDIREGDATVGFGLEPDTELISHLSATVSSLRLRHQEQLHLQSLFMSTLEALARRSLEHEASIRSLTVELQSLRDSNSTLGRENDDLALENSHLRTEMQELKKEITERDTAVEAMTGAVRGLEGWIESAGHSRGLSLQRHLVRTQDSTRRREGWEVAATAGKGKSGVRYHRNDDCRHTVGGGSFLTTDGEPMDIREGVMAWVRGFKDVEEGLKARVQDHDKGRRAKQVDERPSSNNESNQDVIQPSDDEFGDFETSR